jgi:ribonuclease P protein component
MLGRLRSTAEFERVKREGGYWGGRRCGINAARQPVVTEELGRDRQHPARIGLITSRKIGNAVKRNRARRLMRESIRQLAAALAPEWDIVVIARPAIAAPGVRMQDVRDELQGLLTKASLLNPGLR